MSDQQARESGRPAARGGPATRRDAAEYVERLLPSPATWLVAVAMAGCAWVIALPIDPTAAVLAALLVGAGSVAALIAASPVVGVRDHEVIAGRAHLPVRYVHAAEPLGRAETRRAVGPELDARSMLKIRPWVRTAVRISLDDPDDPVPTWIVSSRDPERFAAAIAAGRQSGRGHSRTRPAGPSEGVAGG